MKQLTCYACGHIMTADQHSEADGHCPACGIEIDLEIEKPDWLKDPE